MKESPSARTYVSNGDKRDQRQVKRHWQTSGEARKWQWPTRGDTHTQCRSAVIAEEENESQQCLSFSQPDCQTVSVVLSALCLSPPFLFSLSLSLTHCNFPPSSTSRMESKASVSLPFQLAITVLIWCTKKLWDMMKTDMSGLTYHRNGATEDRNWILISLTPHLSPSSKHDWKHSAICLEFDVHCFIFDLINKKKNKRHRVRLCFKITHLLSIYQFKRTGQHSAAFELLPSALQSVIWHGRAFSSSPIMLVLISLLPAGFKAIAQLQQASNDILQPQKQTQRHRKKREV